MNIGTKQKKKKHLPTATTYTTLQIQTSAIMFKPRFANKSFGRLAIPGIGITALAGGYFYYREPAANPSKGGQAERSRQKRDKEALSGAGIGGNATSGGHETGQPGSGIQPGTGDVERDVQTSADKDKLPAGGVGGGYGGGNSNVRAVDVNAKKDTKNDVNSSMNFPSSGGGSKKLPAKDDSGNSGSSGSSSSSGSSGSSNSSGSNDSNAGSTGASASESYSSLRSRSGASPDDEARIPSTDYKVHPRSYPTSSQDHQPNSTTQHTEGTSISQRLQNAFGQGGKKTAEPGAVQKMYDDPRVQSNHADTPTKRHNLRSDS